MARPSGFALLESGTESPLPSDWNARYERLATHDTSNAETRTLMARTSRQAGEACRAMASRPGAEGLRWRTKAVGWFEKSLVLYKQLKGAGALAGSDVAAADEVTGRLAELQPVSSR